MTPIEKNIAVIDEQGNDYEATYPKRAKGLVKNGRARFIDEHTICLACPPNRYLEDNDMSDHSTPESAIALNEEIDEALQNDPQTDAEHKNGAANKESAAPAAPSGLTIDWVLSRIDKIISDTEHIRSTLKALQELQVAPYPGTGADVANSERAQAMGDVVKCRETTNQQTLKLLEKMYDDLKPPKSFGPFASSKFEGIKYLAEDLPPVQKAGLIRELAGLPQNANAAPGALPKQIRQVLDEIKATAWDEIPDDIRNAVAQGITAQLARNW